VTRYLVEWNGSRWINYGPWLGAARERRFFTSPRILVKQIIDWSDRRIWAAATDEELYNTQNAFNLIPKKDWNIYFLLGVINSKLMTFYHKKRYLDEHKMRFQKILIKDAKRFPIHGNTRPHVREADLRKNISEAVQLMQRLRGEQRSVRLPNEQVQLARKIHALDDRIDELVFTLYDLTPAERAIVNRTIVAVEK
jgi:hypothetical protein